MAAAIVTCAWCLRQHRSVNGRTPPRHGFNIVGAGRGRGHEGAWHTGPCDGFSYPHLGISTDGTVAALGAAVAAETQAHAWLAKLATRPPLRYENTHYRKPSTWIELVDGTPMSTMDGTPSYDYVHGDRTREAEARLASISQTIAALGAVLLDWTAEKYAAQPVGPKLGVVHLAASWRFARGEQPLTVAACQRGNRRPSFVGTSRLATDPAAVTCTRCK